MTRSQLHEDMIDDIRDAITRKDLAFCIAIETSVANAIWSCLKGEKLRADLYFEPYDEFGIIFVEVGHMKQLDKWSNYRACDGNPARVLRIHYDGSIGFINPRNTPQEHEIMNAIREYEYANE